MTSTKLTKKLHSSIMIKTILYAYVHFLEEIFFVFMHNWQSDDANAPLAEPRLSQKL